MSVSSGLSLEVVGDYWRDSALRSVGGRALTKLETGAALAARQKRAAARMLLSAPSRPPTGCARSAGDCSAARACNPAPGVGFALEQTSLYFWILWETLPAAPHVAGDCAGLLARPARRCVHHACRHAARRPSTFVTGHARRRLARRVQLAPRNARRGAPLPASRGARPAAPERPLRVPGVDRVTPRRALAGLGVAEA